MSSVRITTVPREGPFMIRQTVQFLCEVDADANVTSFMWNNLDDIFGSWTNTGSNFSRSYFQEHLRYCFYSCTALSVGGTVGKATKVIEVHGKLINL